MGIERSLQMLIIVNAGTGLLVAVSLLGRALAGRLVLLATVTALAWLSTFPGTWKLWDSAWLAVYKTNEIEPYYTRDVLRTMMRNTEVLYYGEGSEAVVSAVRSGNYQGFITNGRTESSNTPVDLQCVYTLGHLPMLLAKNPKNVFVLGTGAGVTLGATTVHPTVEKVTLVEIEPKVLGVARTFSRYNHKALDNPKVKVVFNDGRNFLMTSREKFDVITADPVHPWFSGAGYLYTREYFRLAAEHLNPGGIICQWLPIYELTGDNLRSVVRTFREEFRYTMIWMTQYDMELVGSHTPIVLDEAALARRMAVPEVAGDLTSVKMGSVEDFLSYFLMGDGGTGRYSQGAVVNTDDNVYLEFSAPLSVGRTSLVADNIDDAARLRESIIPYLLPAAPGNDRSRQLARWRENERAAAVADRLHAIYYRNDREYEYVTLMKQLETSYPRYAPYQIMYDDYKQTYRY
jgi:spermidine synthase